MSGQPELSRPVATARLRHEESEVIVEATSSECAAIAERLRIVAVGMLRCVWKLSLGEQGVICAEAALHSRVTQNCVVTLEPFEDVVTELFEVRFVLAGQIGSSDEPDDPDELLYDGVTLDLGEASVEQLALCLPAYPRSPSAELGASLEPGAGTAFAALAKRGDLD